MKNTKMLNDEIKDILVKKLLERLKDCKRAYIFHFYYNLHSFKESFYGLVLDGHVYYHPLDGSLIELDFYPYEDKEAKEHGDKIKGQAHNLLVQDENVKVHNDYIFLNDLITKDELKRFNYKLTY